MLRIGAFLLFLGFIQVMAKGVEVTTLKGRVVDAKCHITMDMTGPGHAKCAAKCIQDGFPAALVADSTNQIFFFIFEDPTKGKEQLVKLAEKRVEVNGKVYQEAHAIEVKSIKELKEPAIKN